MVETLTLLSAFGEIETLRTAAARGECPARLCRTSASTASEREAACAADDVTGSAFGEIEEAANAAAGGFEETSPTLSALEICVTTGEKFTTKGTAFFSRVVSFSDRDNEGAI